MQHPRLVLVTGAFGNLGRSVVSKLVAEGHRVRAFDLPTPANRRAAARVDAATVEVLLGDVTRDEDVERAVDGVDAIAHLAAILPPVSERKPAAARAVNLEGTRRVIDAAVRRNPNMPFVLTSSFSVYGPSAPARGIARGDSPTEASDVYTETKLGAEDLLRASPLAWVILRVGAAVEGSGANDPVVIRLMFEVHPDNPIELVHGEDVATAVARAIDVPEAHRKVLPIGGGPTCRLTQRELLATTLGTLGVRDIPTAAFGRSPYYTPWLDTEESQRLLRYQEHDLEAIKRDLAARFGVMLPVIRLFGPVIRWGLLRLSGPLRGDPPRPRWQDHIDAGR